MNNFKEPVSNKTVPYHYQNPIQNPYYQSPDNKQVAVQNNNRSSLKTSEETEEGYLFIESSEKQIVEMKKIAIQISEINAKAELEGLIEKYKQELEAYSSAEEGVDFDRMCQSAQIFIMLNMRKDGANCQELEEFAEANVIHLRDDIKKEQDSWKKLGFAIFSGGLIIAGASTGIYGSYHTIQSLEKAQIQAFGQVHNLDVKGIMSLGQGISGIGQGTQAVEKYFDAHSQAELSVLNSRQQLAQQKDGQFRDEKRRTDQALEAARAAAKQVAEARHQTVLVFVRNNY